MDDLACQAVEFIVAERMLHGREIIRQAFDESGMVGIVVHGHAILRRQAWSAGDNPIDAIPLGDIKQLRGSADTIQDRARMHDHRGKPLLQGAHRSSDGRQWRMVATAPGGRQCMQEARAGTRAFSIQFLNRSATMGDGA